MAEGFKASNNITPENRSAPREASWSGRDFSDEETWFEYRQPLNESVLDFSYLDLDSVTLQQNMDRFTTAEDNCEEKLTTDNASYLYLQHNRLEFLPENLLKFHNLLYLDLSNNHLIEIGQSVLQLVHLTVLIARNNSLGDYSLPKKFGLLQNLKELNFSGNMFKSLPSEIVDLHNLKALYLGGNEIEEIPQSIWKLEKLEVLYLGGNNLKDIPTEMGRLHCLRSLVLCENQLQSLPSTISCLKKLRSLLLHKNKLTTLPPEIVTLKGLVELSLRDNPLVVRFVQELTYDPPTLRELAARCIKIYKVAYNEDEMPNNLTLYLKSACRCVNPKCKGVYFDVRVEHIKFVDFCGKYRIPLLQYLCSPLCSIQPAVHGSVTDSSSSDDDNNNNDVPASRLRRVLLG